MKLNIGVTAWSPLAGGVLNGKYQGQAAVDSSSELISTSVDGRTSWNLQALPLQQ
jgi:aryl-alcohol dehydrogenase-like predicted oxidoreductase